MRHSPHFQHILPCLSACISAGVILSGPYLCRAQDRGPSRIMRESYKSEYRTSFKEEERLSPAVRELKEALSVIREEEPSIRKTNLSNAIAKLRGVRDLRQALMLHEWRDNDLNKDVADVDSGIRKDVEGRFVEAVRGGLKSGETNRQLSAADFLSEIGVSIRGTTGGDSTTRRSLAAGFAPDLAEMLKGKNPAVNAAAARALGKIYPDPKVAIGSLEPLLQAGQVSEQRAAAGALTGLVRVADQLYKASQAELPEQLVPRGEIIDVDRGAVQAASRGLRNPDPEVRRQCVETLHLAGIALGELAPFLRPSEEEPKDVTAPAEQRGDLLPLAKALGDQGDFLGRLLKDPRVPIRLLAAHTLEEMGNARTRLLRVAGRVAKTPGEKEEERKDSLPQEALSRGLRAALPALSESLSDPDPEVRLAAVEVLETLGSDAAPAAGALTKALADRNVFVRWAAARTLANLDPSLDPKAAETAVPGLARELFDPDLDAREAAAATLERYGPVAKAAVPEMARAIGVGDAESRVAVIRTLGAVNPADAQPAIPALSEALSHLDDRVRRAAAEALGRIGPLARDAEPALRRALNDNEDTVRQAAAEALISLNLKK